MKNIVLEKNGKVVYRHTTTKEVDFNLLKTKLNELGKAISDRSEEDTIIFSSEELTEDEINNSIYPPKTEEEKQLDEINSEIAKQQEFDAKVAASLARLGFTKDKDTNVGKL